MAKGPTSDEILSQFPSYYIVLFSAPTCAKVKLMSASSLVEVPTIAIFEVMCLLPPIPSILSGSGVPITIFSTASRNAFGAGMSFSWKKGALRFPHGCTHRESNTCRFLRPF